MKVGILPRMSADSLAAMRGRIIAVCVGVVFMAVTYRASLVAMGATPEAAYGPAPAIAQAAKRADIVDRHGELLATSLTIDSLAADPREIWDAREVAEGLATVFEDLNVDRLVRQLEDPSRKFVWIRRKVSPRQRQAVFELGLEGLRFEKEVQRIYTGGALAGHLLGFANVDSKGIAGLEYMHDAYLSAGGEPLRLTIDTGVQFALEDELQFAADAYGVIGAAGLVIEARTGAVRAIASWPTVDPNRAGDADENARLNRAIGAVYELGSVFKPLTVAAGFEAGELLPGDRFDVSRPMRVGAMVVHDDHPMDDRASVSDIIAYSSNIGTVRIAQLVGLRRHRAFLESIGLLSRPDVAFPGAAHPLAPAEWDDLVGATVSYGHGLAVSPLALATAYTAFANDGEMVRPRFVEPGPQDEIQMTRVMAAPTAQLVTQMMRSVVTEGTGRRADVYGYEVAGKTGTAEKPGPDGYDPDRNVTSFISIFPASRPEYVILIVLDEPAARPGEGKTAAYNAAPVTGRLVARIAPMLDVAPVLEEPPSPMAENEGVRAVSEKRAL